MNMKTKLRNVTVLAVACIALLAGCKPSKTVDAPQSYMIRVAGNSRADVYVVNIEGADYIVVIGAYKAAICPKAR